MQPQYLCFRWTTCVDRPYRQLGCLVSRREEGQRPCERNLNHDPIAALHAMLISHSGIDGTSHILEPSFQNILFLCFDPNFCLPRNGMFSCTQASIGQGNAPMQSVFSTPCNNASKGTPSRSRDLLLLDLHSAHSVPHAPWYPKTRCTLILAHSPHIINPTTHGQGMLNAYSRPSKFQASALAF